MTIPVKSRHFPGSIAPILFALALTGISSGIFAQTVATNALPGPTGYFRCPVFRDNLSLSMGGSGVAVLDNMLAMFGDNPASLNQRQKSYDFYLAGLLGTNTGFGIGVADTHTSDLSAALAFYLLGDQNNSNFSDSNTSMRLSFSLGYTAASVLSFALRGTFNHGQRLFATTNNFFTFTPGILLSLPVVEIGFAASDIFTIGEVNFPSYYSLGVSGSVKKLLLSLQGDYFVGRPLFPDTGYLLHFGLRYPFEKFIALSAGYSFNISTYRQAVDEHSISLGLEFFADKHRLYLSDVINVSRAQNTLEIGYRFVPISGKPKADDPYGSP